MNPNRHVLLLAGRTACAVALAVAAVACSAISAQAAIESREILKTFFETGDIPTQDQFQDLIDSALNFHDDGLTNYRLVVDSSSRAVLLGPGAEIGPGLAFAPLAAVPGLSDEWLGHSGFLPLLVTQNSESHYGYLQMMSAGTPGNPYAVSVEYWVFEGLANTPITTAFVPEPGSLLLSGMGLCGLAAWAWRRRTR